WACIEVGEEDRARALLAEAQGRAIVQCHQLALLDILRIRALLAIHRQQWAEAAGALDESLAASRTMRYQYAEAKALSVCGHLHATRGELDAAREKYPLALAICDRLGEGLYRPHIARTFKEVDSG